VKLEIGNLKLARLVPMLLVGGLMLLSGCQIFHPGFTSMAFVEIEKTSLETVHAATVTVFKQEGYKVLWSKAEKIVFVREATLDDRLRYARYEESLRMRVELSLERYGEDGVLVRAEAYAVRGESGRSEVKILRAARRPYMELLRRVKENVKSPPPKAAQEKTKE
jgi:hypothetical protein